MGEGNGDYGADTFLEAYYENFNFFDPTRDPYREILFPWVPQTECGIFSSNCSVYTHIYESVSINWRNDWVVINYFHDDEGEGNLLIVGYHDSKNNYCEIPF